MKISQPAFPTWIVNDSMCPGMNLRDYFAAAAMQSLIQIAKSNVSADQISWSAYSYADAMMEERK